jgi:hypothetical protein
VSWVPSALAIGEGDTFEMGRNGKCIVGDKYTRVGETRLALPARKGLDAGNEGDFLGA